MRYLARLSFSFSLQYVVILKKMPTINNNQVVIRVE